MPLFFYIYLENFRLEHKGFQFVFNIPLSVHISFICLLLYTIQMLSR